jgi:hypothetical protein
MTTRNVDMLRDITTRIMDMVMMCLHSVSDRLIPIKPELAATDIGQPQRRARRADVQYSKTASAAGTMYLLMRNPYLLSEGGAFQIKSTSRRKVRR